LSQQVDLLEACVAFLIIAGSVSAYKFLKKYEFMDVVSSSLCHLFWVKATSTSTDVESTCHIFLRFLNFP
jgi:hypothetical protein